MSYNRTFPPDVLRRKANKCIVIQTCNILESVRSSLVAKYGQVVKPKVRPEMSPGVRVAPGLGESRVPRKGGDLYPAGEREPLQTSEPQNNMIRSLHSVL